MTYQELLQKINAGDYDSKLPYPPFRPAKVEREMWALADRIMKQEYRDDEHRLEVAFKNDLREYITSEELHTTITDKQFNAIYRVAYEKGHANGYSDILSQVGDILNVVCEFVK
jgi:GH24 family phage-related lysozyme (muramidase)